MIIVYTLSSGLFVDLSKLLFFFPNQQLDLAKEIVDVSATDTFKVNHLISHIPTEGARYHLYNFSHTHEGDATDSVGEYIGECVREM